MNISNRVQEDTRSFKHPMYRHINVLLVFQRHIPRVMGMLTTHPGSITNRLDGLYCDATLLASRDQRIEILSIIRTLHRNIVVRKQHRVKIEASETTTVRSRYLQTMTCNANSPYQPPIFRIEGRLN